MTVLPDRDYRHLETEAEQQTRELGAVKVELREMNHRIGVLEKQLQIAGRVLCPSSSSTKR